MNKRRGRIMGMKPVDGMQKLVAEAPQAEMFKYATDLRDVYKRHEPSFRAITSCASTSCFIW